MRVPLIEQVKIQAQVLVPLVRTLQAELGEERANALVQKSLGELYRKYGEAWSRTHSASTVSDRVAMAFERFAAEDALDYEILKQTPDTFEFNVTGCRYAKFYQEIGVPELGFLLTCSADFKYAEGLDSDVQLTRTRTIMQGADHCDFRYKLRQKTGESIAQQSAPEDALQQRASEH